MGQIVWGAEPEMFGPRHAHREQRILRRLSRCHPAPDGPHLDCAAGVGSLAMALAGRGRAVVAADRSLRSLVEVARRAGNARVGARPLPLVADITALPFPDATFASATSAETLEHVPDDARAAAELARVLCSGGALVGTVPADPGQTSDWDRWAGHLRRYSPASLQRLLTDAGLEPDVTAWGWPVVRAYDAAFLRRLNRRRLHTEDAGSDARIRAAASLGRRRWLVGVVRALMALDRLFDGCRWGVGLLFAGRKPSREEMSGTAPGASASREA